MRQERPDDSGILVGQRYGGDVLVPPPHDPGQPTARMIGFSVRQPDQGARAVDQQGSQVAVSALADAEQGLLAAARVLLWNKSEPGGQLPAVGERIRIANRRHQRAGRDRPDTGDFCQLPARVVGPVPGLNLNLQFMDLPVIDGRPRFAKRSIDDGKQVKIAAIDPDFDRGHSLCP